jgi:phosphatidylglycerol:prolipoprotein diacylglycerol transferase
MLCVAGFCAFLVLQADLRRRGIKMDAAEVLVYGAAAGIAGSKLWHVLETPRQLIANPTGLLFDRTGFAWFGGLVAGVFTLIFLGWRSGLKPLQMLDACAPAAAIGYGMGRIGCLLSGDGDYGIPASLPWAMSFPHGTVPTMERVHPTPIYEFAVAMFIAWYLWRRGIKSIQGLIPAGQVTAEYFILSGTARFLVEFIRINPRVFWGMSNAQVASLASISAGVVILASVRRRTQPGGASEGLGAP